MQEKHSYIRRRDVLRMVLVIAIVALVAAAGAWVYDRCRDSRSEAAVPTVVETDDESGLVRYKGKTYAPKEGLKTYLFMGIDSDSEASDEGNGSYIDGGQADVQLLVVVDESAGTWRMLQLNRDSIAEVQVLGLTGQVIRTVETQITLAHAYGSGGKDSCVNARTAVSTLLGGCTIDGYLAMNMGGIATLNDFVGGVTVTIESDFSEIDPSLVMGETVTLTGEQAYSFIRYRKGVDDQTNLSRMSRHRQYLEGLSEKLAGMSENELLKCYDAVFDYIVTDMGSKTLVNLAEQMQATTQLDTLTIEGTSCLDDEGCNAVKLDEDSLNEVVLTLFYEEQS